jgi:hypothetical protein
MNKQVLKKYSINKTIFDELFHATVNYDDEIASTVNIETALPYNFFSKCRHPEKVEKVLKKNDLCFLTSLRLQQDLHIFQCKYTDGKIEKYEIQKKYCKSIKDAFEIALVNFLSRGT